MIVADIFAHYYISGRNTLAIMLIVRSYPVFYSLTLCFLQEAVATQESYNLSSELKELLQKLASLYNHKNSKVALSARKVFSQSS